MTNKGFLLCVAISLVGWRPLVPGRDLGGQTLAPGSSKFIVSDCFQAPTYRNVLGVVSPSIDLSQDDVVKQLITLAANQLQEQCPRPTGFRSINITLRVGDPNTFTEQGVSYKTRPPGRWLSRAEYLRLYEERYPGPSIEFQNTGSETLDLRFVNPFRQAREYKAQVEREAQLAKQQESERARQLAADNAAKRQAQEALASRSAAFVSNYGVKRFVTAAQLGANPFVYQGQVVAVYGTFGQMTSATQAIFADGMNAFQVSSVPAARFTQPNVMVMLAARVVGNVEVRLPLLGLTLVPNLVFVGSAFCQQQNCTDYAINIK